MSGTVVPGGPRVPAELSDTITVQQDGSTVAQAVNTLNFSGGTVEEDGHGRVTVTTSGGGGSVHTNSTLTGNGTSGSPLGINPGNVPVDSDGTTITGNGTTGSPLTVNTTSLTGLVAVDTDSTLTGNGTSGSHLGVNPGHVPVVADGTTILGNGTTGTPLAVNVGHIPVAVDGTSITGDGTTGNPLVAVGGGGGGVNVLDQDSTVVAGATGIRFLGTPVAVTVDGVDPTIADVTVTIPTAANFLVTLPADVGSGFVPGQVGYQDPLLSHRFSPSICNDTEKDAQVLGMCTQNQVGATQVVCVGGVVVLTAPEWATVIFEGGPLVEGVYYLADNSGSLVGMITAVKPTTPGQFVTVVGYAMRLNGDASTLGFVVRPQAAVLIP